MLCIVILLSFPHILDILDYSRLLYITSVYILCVLLYIFKPWVLLTSSKLPPLKDCIDRACWRIILYCCYLTSVYIVVYVPFIINLHTISNVTL